MPGTPPSAPAIPDFSEPILKEPVFSEPTGGIVTTKLTVPDHHATNTTFLDHVYRPRKGDALNIHRVAPGDENSSHAVAVTSNAVVEVKDATAINISVSGNTGDLRIVNQGRIKTEGRAIALRAVNRSASGVETGDIIIANHGEIVWDTRKADIPPTMRNGRTITPTNNVVAGSINKASEPHDHENYGTRMTVTNGPTGRIHAYGKDSHRVNGMKGETGAGHTSEFVNEGLIHIQAGTSSRGISAQSLWGQSKALNSGVIRVTGPDGAGGRWVVGLYANNCAPWPHPGNGCHGTLSEIVPDPVKLHAGPVIAHNRAGAAIDVKGSDRGAGILVNNWNSGLHRAINDGYIRVAGPRSRGMHGNGHLVAKYTEVMPDTSANDISEFVNNGTIRVQGDSSQGIDAIRSRGGAIHVTNGATGMIAVSGGINQRVKVPSVGVRVDSRRGKVPKPGCPTIVTGNVTWEDDCVTDSQAGPVEIVNNGTIRVEGEDAIGIEAFSEGGSIIVRGAGSIWADGIGVKAETGVGGNVSITLTGAIHAAEKCRVRVGGVEQADACAAISGNALDRALVDRIDSFALEDAQGGGGTPLRLGSIPDGGLRLMALGRPAFLQIDLPEAGAEGADSAAAHLDSWGLAMGRRFDLGGLTLTPAMLLGRGDVGVVEADGDRARRTYEWQGLALRLGGERNSLEAAVAESRHDTVTARRRPGFSLDLREPDGALSRFRLLAKTQAGKGGTLALGLGQSEFDDGGRAREVDLTLRVNLPLR